MASPIISVRNIYKSFGRAQVIQDLNFDVAAGSCFGFLGPNGAGKTTLMKILYGRCLRDDSPLSSVDVFGYDPKESELAIKFLSGIVPQENNLDSELNVVDNLNIYARFYALPPPVAKERIEELLEFMELQEKRYSLIKTLSGGMQRRLIIARALINKPVLLILDEPTTALDPQVRHLIWDKLRQLKKQGTTLLLTTHYMEEAFAICDTLMIMHKGKMITQGTPRQLIELHVEKYVLEIVGSQAFNLISLKKVPLSARMDRADEMMRLYSDDLQHLKEVAHDLEQSQYYLRETDLEDVFIKMTGRKLDD